MTSPIVPPRGPFPAPIAIVGEAPGEKEVQYGQPFIGASGSELTRMIEDAGLNPKSIYFTNVFKIRPPNNKVDHFFVPKKEGAADVPPLAPGRYIPPSGLFWLELLRQELLLVQPRIIIAVGNTALWGLTGLTGVAKRRGVLHTSPLGTILPTYHPAAVIRSWSLRPIVVADLGKARAFLDGDLSTPSEDHSLWLNPTIADFSKFRELVLASSKLGVDVETSHGTITMVGVATSPREGFCIPFWDPETNQSYWGTLDEECAAWELVAWIMSTDIPKVGHNFVYDIQYFAAHHIVVRNFLDDTMLMHHAYQPEMQKSLGTLGATYLNESAWKELRHRKGSEIVKEGE